MIRVVHNQENRVAKNETACIFKDMERYLLAMADTLPQVQNGMAAAAPEEIIQRHQAYEQCCQELLPRDFQAFRNHKDAIRDGAADEVEFLRALANVCKILAQRAERGERLERPLNPALH